MPRRILLPVLFALCGAAASWPGSTQEPRFPPTPEPPAERTSLPATPIASRELLAALREGGLILYFRHTSTDMSRDDSRSRGDEDCENQRPLTDAGRNEARQIGAAFRELKIPVREVLASPRCRTMETAMLAFGRAHGTRAVRGGPATPDDPDRYAALRKLLSTSVGPGANLVISSHGNPIYAVAGAPYLEEGEALVIRPLGNDFEVVARVRYDEWRALLR